MKDGKRERARLLTEIAIATGGATIVGVTRPVAQIISGSVERGWTNATTHAKLLEAHVGIGAATAAELAPWRRRRWL